MSCQEHQILMGKYRDGLIEDSQLSALRKHIEECSVCGEEFENFAKIQGIVKEAFYPKTASAEARQAIMSKISRMPSLAPDKSRSEPIPPSFRRWIPASASGLLILGLLIGFSVARLLTSPLPGGMPQDQVPIQISSLEGTVLVKHRDSQIWEELKSSSRIYLGDIFQSSAKSRMTLLFEDKSKLILDSNSIFSLKLYDGEVEFNLNYGTVTVALNSPHSPFIISTPQGRIQALGTEFTVSVK